MGQSVLSKRCSRRRRAATKGWSSRMPGTKRRRVDHVEVKLESSEISTGGGSVVSKYFTSRKPRCEVEQEDEKIDFEYVKSLSSGEYFDRMESLTSDDPMLWRQPLSGTVLSKLYSRSEIVPKNFLPIFTQVREMRSHMVTPVDRMGCPRIPILVSKQFGISRDQIRPIDYRLQLLISLILASQTKDETVTKAMYNIMNYCITEFNDSRGITLKSLKLIPVGILENLIKSTGFYHRKAIYIKQTVLQLQEVFDSDVPHDIKGMTSLSGVGPKIGYLALQKSWGLIDGICVDVHVDRLCRLWGWVPSSSTTRNNAEETRIAVEKWLPKELWYDFNTILVGFGQMICGPRIRRCDLCLANQVCPASQIK